MLRIPKILLPRIDWLLCAIIVAWGAVRLLPGLGHPGMPRWDESIHQVVARGTMTEPLRPHVYHDHLFPYSNADWVNGGTWVHKPPMPFWLGSSLLHVTGITPLALRLVSFLADLVVALAMFLLMRRSVGRWLSALAGAAFLSLDFTWALTQGFRFGDVTDTTLAACLVVSVLAVVRAACFTQKGQPGLADRQQAFRQGQAGRDAPAFNDPSPAKIKRRWIHESPVYRPDTATRPAAAPSD